MRMRRRRPSTPALKCNGFTDSLSAEVFPVRSELVPRHLPSLPEDQHSTEGISLLKLPVDLSFEEENLQMLSISGSVSRNSRGRRRLVCSASTIAEIEEIPKLPKLSSQTHDIVIDSGANALDESIRADTELTTLALRNKIQRRYTYPMPPRRPRSTLDSDKSVLEHLPSLNTRRTTTNTVYVREDRRTAIREHVENAQKTFDAGTSKEIMFNKWIKSQ